MSFLKEIFCLSRYPLHFVLHLRCTNYPSKVEHTLYRVPEGLLTDASEVFRDMITMAEAGLEDEPVLIPWVKAEAFDVLLDFLLRYAVR